MKKLSLRINQTNRLVSQQFYFLETRKFSYLRLSRGANFSSFKITKLHVLLYEISWTKVYLWLTFALSVCLQELWWSRFRRVAVFSWRRAGGSDPTLYQLTRWKGTKKRFSVWKVNPRTWDLTKIRETSYGIRDLFKIQCGIRETFYGIRDFTATQEAGFTNLERTMYDWEKSNFRNPNLVTSFLCIYLINPFIFAILKWTDTFVKLEVV